MNTRITIYLNDFVKAQNFLKDVEKFNSDVNTEISELQQMFDYLED